MEIITFESEVFKDLVSKINSIAAYVSREEGSVKSSDEIWMDTLDVCQLLNISSRTLQRLRNEKFIPYTMLRGKCIYRLVDIEKALSARLIKGDAATLADFKKRYVLRLANNKSKNS